MLCGLRTSERSLEEVMYRVQEGKNLHLDGLKTFLMPRSYQDWDLGKPFLRRVLVSPQQQLPDYIVPMLWMEPVNHQSWMLHLQTSLLHVLTHPQAPPLYHVKMNVCQEQPRASLDTWGKLRDVDKGLGLMGIHWEYEGSESWPYSVQWYQFHGPTDLYRFSLLCYPKLTSSHVGFWTILTTK